MPDSENGALESRARRAAARAGLKARKSRWRQGSIDNLGGFQLIDPIRNSIVLGERFDLSAVDVIEYCSNRFRKAKGATPDAGVLEETQAKDEVTAEFVPARVVELSGTVLAGSSSLTVGATPTGSSVPLMSSGTEKDQADNKPPSAPDPGPGSIFVPTPGGFELTPRVPEEAERDDVDQKALHVRLRLRVERLRGAMTRIDNTHPILAAEFADYAAFVAPELAELDVASLWSAGSGLFEFVRAFDTQDLSNTITPPLEPEILAEFRALIRDHTAFILGFDTGRKLTERAAALYGVERRPEEIRAAALAVLRPMLNTPRLLADRAQHLIQSLTRALENWPAKTFPLLVGGVETGKNGLIGFGRALHAVILSATTIDLALTALSGVPDADTLRAAALYLHNNSGAVTAFIASDPQLSEWLLWWIARARSFVARQTGENLVKTRGQGTPSVPDLPSEQAKEGRVSGWQIGNRVLALWPDNYWYTGTITAISGKGFLIKYDDGYNKWLNAESVKSLDYGVGDAVECRWKGLKYYYPSHIVEITGGRITVQYDYNSPADGPSLSEKEQTTIELVRFVNHN
jgi:hypothetical protein